ncbi:RelA/SpoT domain-containing protein [Rheinheimera muenzenbergensis]|uniref:RelA/SpoT domain-containing protein n=1 Tax=Rheinheimera muenzenbergensis TaxID=1193628 RepID=A0ABU8C2A7_9GAMM
MQQHIQRSKAPILSKNQIDQLGSRLRTEDYSEDDLRTLDHFRRAYVALYEDTVNTIRQTLHLAPTGRPAKSTSAIRDKLCRSSMRLSQMQDIAGCRIVVEDHRLQDEVVTQLQALFPASTVVDRRKTPSHGYRAVHVIVWHQHQAVEIQIRTELQQAWAEYAEKLADTVDPALKYGGGPQGPRDILKALSKVGGFVEQIELEGAGQHQQFAAALAEVASRLADLHKE